MLASEVLALEVASQTGQDVRLSYLASPNQSKVEYIGWAPIGAPTDVERWKVAKIIYNNDLCEERILTSALQIKWDDRTTFFSTRYGV